MIFLQKKLVAPTDVGTKKIAIANRKGEMVKYKNFYQ